MALAVDCRIQCFRRTEKAKKIHTTRFGPLRLRHVAQRRLHHAEKQPHERVATTNPSKPFKQSEAWNRFFASLQTLEGDVADENVVMIVKALRFSMSISQRIPLEFPFLGRRLVQKSMSVASILTSLRQARGIISCIQTSKQEKTSCLENPYADAASIAAALLVEHVWKEHVSVEDVRTVMGPDVTELVKTVISIRELVDGVDVLEDATALKIQEMIFEQCDRRAILLQFVSSLDVLYHSYGLYIYVSVGRRLDMNELAAGMEDYCMEILFPASHSSSVAHLREITFRSESIFDEIRNSLTHGMEERRELKALVDRVEIKTRVKSPSSFMRKELSLTELAKGGRRREEIHDILGVRVVAWPRCPEEICEEMAVRGCYVICDLAHELWPVLPHRSKDYIKNPKPNGYQSLHTTHRIKMPTLAEEVPSEPCDNGEENAHGGVMYPELEAFHDGSFVIDDPAKNDRSWIHEEEDHLEEATFELQIRTRRMDEEAEHGTAAHSLYKSGFHH